MTGGNYPPCRELPKDEARKLAKSLILKTGDVTERPKVLPC